MSTSPSKRNLTEKPLLSWPQSASHEPEYTIGQVLSVLQKQFPALTPSKLRYLEDEGLVSPFRLPSGYRKYCEADVERVRYILTMQRDSYVPLKRIGEKLAALDLGHEDEDVVPRARIIASDGVVETPAKPYISVRELTELTGATRAEVEELTKLGMITPDLAGYFPTGALQVVRAFLQLQELGVSARALRTVKTSADRHADLIEQVVAPLRARNRSNDKERAYAQSRDLSSAVIALYAELLRSAVDDLNA